MYTQPSLEILRNHIDITKVPFSNRGSRMLVHQMVSAPRLNVKLAERLTSINPYYVVLWDSALHALAYRHIRMPGGSP